LQRLSAIVSSGGPFQIELRAIRFRIAAASVNGLKALPACRCPW
jgi:hypothetical protein